MNRSGYAAVAALAIAGTAGAVPAAQAAQPTRHSATARPSIGGTTFPLVAFVPEGTGATAQVTTFGQGQTPSLHTITYSGDQFGSAIAPDGSSALLATVDNIDVLKSITSNPVSQKLIDVSQFGNEGGNGLIGAATSVAMNDKTAVAAVAGQGIVQLRKSGGSWTIDNRLDIAGSKKDHTHKERGFIPIPRGNEKHTIRFDAVALSPVPTPNGHYIAIAVARKRHLIQVIGKIGTAHPTILGRISDPGLKVLGNSTDQFGDGEVEFSPATSTRAVIATSSGAAILDLDVPAHPKLFAPKGQPLPTDDQPTDLAVAPDGDTVSVASGNGIATYTGLLTGHHLRFESISELVGDGSIEGLAYLADGDLAIQRFDVVNNEDRPYFDLDSTSGALISEAQLQTVGVPGALSVGPGIFPTEFNNKTHLTVAAGDKVKIPLFLQDGIGSYTFSIYAGHLPTGLRLHRNRITGRTTDTGRHSVTIRALNQYGGAAFLHLHLRVSH